MGREQRRALIEQIETHRQSRVICCVTSDRQNAQGLIAKDFIPKFFEHLRDFESTQIDTFIFSLGGDTLAAFGLSRLLREFSQSVGALIPEKCHSGGTLFALGANEVFMTRVATLSPFDPSVATPLNPMIELQPGIRQTVAISVESVAGFKELVKEEWRLNDEGATAAFRILAERVNPLALGQAYRTRQQIEQLARTLLSTHRRDERNIKIIVERLTRQLGSHDYLISRAEARQLLGPQVLGDDKTLERSVWSLFQDFSSDMSLGQGYDPAIVINTARAGNQPLPARVLNKLAIIESRGGSDVWETQILLSPMQVATPQGPTEQPIQQVVYNGWRHYN